MHSPQLVRLVPTPETISAFVLIESLENPFAENFADSHSEMLCWQDGDWALVANSKMVIRQPAHSAKKLTDAQAGRYRGKQPFFKDDAAFVAWVNDTINKRNTEAGFWHKLDMVARDERMCLETTPLHPEGDKCTLKISDYGIHFMLALNQLPGIPEHHQIDRY